MTAGPFAPHRADLHRRVALGLAAGSALLLAVAVLFALKALSVPSAPKGPLMYGVAAPNPWQALNDDFRAVLCALLATAAGVLALAVDRVLGR